MCIGIVLVLHASGERESETLTHLRNRSGNEIRVLPSLARADGVDEAELYCY